MHKKLCIQRMNLGHILMKLPMVNIIYNISNQYVIRYPAPANLNYFWNFGFISLFFLVTQLVSGLFLAMFYTPHIEYAFFSIEYIMNDINYGWFLRYVHANGASFFFFAIYVHIIRGMYYSSYQYPRTHIWITGATIYFLSMGAAFLGYVLPWGQMSFWAATVITNLLTVIPVVGDDLVYFIWGGYAINNATLNRFFSLHYLLPFILVLFVAMHLFMLHETSSSNSLRIVPYTYIKINFYPYYIIKDIATIVYSILFFCAIIFFIPEIFNHSINYVMANPMITPVHIVPEWYFLPFYAILRSIYDKNIGIFIMFLSMGGLYLFTMIDKSSICLKIYSIEYNQLFWVFIFNFIFLGYIGSETVEYPSIELGILCTIVHILYMLWYMPISIKLEAFYSSYRND
jgi:quinol-cytochrome oxidoreductase complex cytochrome b subunit